VVVPRSPRGDHGEPDTGRRESGELGFHPLGVAESQVGDRVQAAPSFCSDYAAPAVPGGHVDLQRVERFGQPAFPEKAEVRKEDGTVESHLVQLADSRPRLPVVVGEGLVVAVVRWLAFEVHLMVSCDR